jgi:Zn-finger nucleic acid-binding protein
MKCPVCSLDLIVVERQGIELDYCIQCRGFWFDAGELELLTQVLGAATPVTDIASLTPVSVSEKTRKCPRCDRAMDKVKLGEGTSVTIDRCPRFDGLWFDAGELGRTIALPAAGAPDSQPLLHFLGEVFNCRAGRPETADRKPETGDMR